MKNNFKKYKHCFSEKDQVFSGGRKPEKLDNTEREYNRIDTKRPPR